MIKPKLLTEIHVGANREHKFELVLIEPQIHNCLLEFEEGLIWGAPLIQLRMTDRNTYLWHCSCGEVIEVEIEE